MQGACMLAKKKQNKTKKMLKDLFRICSVISFSVMVSLGMLITCFIFYRH